MAKDPAFLFYTQDFQTGTQFFSDEQVGKYVRLMCAQHQHGHLSDKQVQSICKGYDEDVMKKFLKDTDGNFYNERLESEIVKRKKFTESRRENAKNPKKKIEAQAEHMLQHMENENENENVFNEQLLSIIEETWKNFFIKKEDKQRHLIGKKEKVQIEELFHSIKSEFTGQSAPPVPNRVIAYLEANYKPKNKFYNEDTELPSVTLNAAVLKQSANGLDFSTEYIQKQWKAFLAERLNDGADKKAKHQNIDDLTSYFLNWLPKQKSIYNGAYKPSATNGNSTAKPGTSEARIATAKNW